MNFTHYDLGHLGSGQIVEVHLSGHAANVKLMDSANFQHYRAGRVHQCFGGHATRSFARLAVPHAGSWHLTIDRGGHAGSVGSAVRVLR